MARNRRFVALATLVAALMLVTGMMGAGTFGRSAAAKDDVAHPIHIHKGACDTLGDVVFPLTDLTKDNEEKGTPQAGVDESATPGAEAYGEGTPDADSGTPKADEYADADSSDTTVSASLADIIAGGHAINAHESAANIQNYIACGNITGTPKDGVLEITLDELNNSGYEGEATLTDNGNGTTDVEVYVYSTEDEMGTPKAGTSGDVAMEIKGFAFSQPALEIPVGTTVTWTNNDTAPHTVTQDGGGIQSGKIDPGATFSFTFDTAGTFTYHCEFHPNMKATITVK